MADWEDAPKGANSLVTSSLANDAALQAVNPQWPTGGTYQQLNQESRFNNNAVSPKGAMGAAQVMPDTLKGVEAQVGRKLDPNNINDAMLIHRYVMSQNLNKFGNVDDALRGYNSGWDPTKWNNPETNNYVQKFNTGTQGGWEDASTAAPINASPAQPVQPTQASTSGWEDAPKDKQQTVVGNLGALALQAANIGAGVVEAPFVAAHAAYEGIKNQSLGDVVQTGLQDFQKFSPEAGLNALGVDTSGLHNQYGYDLPNQAMNFAFDTAPGYLGNQITGEFARQAGINPQAYEQVAGPAAKTAIQAAMMVSPLAEVPHAVGRFKRKPSEAAAEVDKMNTLNESSLPPEPMAPNAGPQRPIVVDSQGNAYPMGTAGRAAEPTSDVLGAEAGKARQQAVEQQAAGDLFPDTLTGEGQASPYEPNRLSSDVQSPVEIPGRNLRQGELDFNQASPPDLLMANSDGEVGTPTQLREGGGVDIVKSRMMDMLERDPVEALDPQSGKDHPAMAAEEAPRSMAPDEFSAAVQALAERDPTKFSVPADMGKAYDRYMDIVRDDTGTMRSKSKSAASFADAVTKEMQDRRVSDHPAVKSNQARVDGLNQRLLEAQAKQAPTSAIEAQIKKAQATLDKSKENIAKQLGKDPLLPWEKDGVVNMFTFGHLPEMFRSIGAILKAIHGMAFKMIDRALPKSRNLNSTGKIITQGIKDYANKQAKRDWSQEVNEKPIQQLNKIEALRNGLREYNPYEGQEISPAELKAQMVSAPDISGNIRAKVAQNIIQGGLQMTNLVKHPLVKYVTETVDRAMRNAKQYVKQNLIGPDGLRTKMQMMSDSELTGIRSLMELNEGKKEFTEAQLRNAGYSDRQIKYYLQSRAEDLAAFKRFNDARQAAGLKPVDRRIAHIAGYFLGDFRSIITDKDGKVVGVVAHNFRPAVNTIVKHFIDNHPEGSSLTASPVQLRKLNESIGSADNRFHGYMEVLNVLKDTNADVGRLVDAYQNYITRDAQRAMADRSKFKSETGVLGAEGRKAWQDATTNAKEGARQELRYLESINKWAEMQEAIGKTKGYLADPDINAPNAKALSQDYIDSVQGRNRGPMQKLLNAMLNGWAEATGIGPSIMKNTNNLTKSALLMKFVGIFKLSHSAVTLLQPLQAMPTINARLSARGVDMGAKSISSVGKALSSSYRLFADKPKEGFEKRAQQFMNDNGTSDVGMSFHLQNVDKGSARSEAIRHVGELNVRIPETGARTFSFMYYAHMLKDLGLPEKETFLTAHNLMRDAMVDYSPHERSLMFGKMGILGDIASTLTRFKYNQIGQHMVGWHDWRQGGSALPLLTTIGTSILLGGVRGVFAYEAANQLTDKLTTFMASHGMMKQPTNLDEIVLKSLHGANQHVADLLNFGIPSAVGVNLTGSLTNADTIPTDPLGALFPTADEFANLGKAAGQFLMQPNSNNAKKAGMAFLPNSLKGLAEDQFFTKNGNYMNPQTGKLEAHRTTADEVKRALSFRPLQEGKESLIAHTENNRQENLNTVRHSIVEQAHSDMISNNGRLTPEQMQRYVQRYVDTGSDPQAFVNDLVQFAGMDQNRTKLERAQGIPSGSMSSVEKYMNVERMK